MCPKKLCRPTYYSASTLQECIVDDPEFNLHGFTDNHAYKKLFDANSRCQEYKTICDLSHCGSEIKTWMDHNRLKMNDSKTEFILFGSRKHLVKCITTDLNVNGNSIPRRWTNTYHSKPTSKLSANQLPSISSDFAKFIVYSPEKQKI